MPAPAGGHLTYVRRYLWPIVVAVGVLLVLGIMLLIGVIQGDVTDLERRQEDPESARVLLDR